MNHTLQSRVRVLLLTLLLASSPARPAASAIPAGVLDLPSASSILSSLWDLLTGEKSTTAAPNGEPQPAATPSGSGTGGSGTSSGDGDGDRGSGMDPNG
ncbi:MAG TPA: hypothetical protein VEL74_04995 [Thermoanaerobaculia bacterium]|nr:hypothetical protein [Thermoanaerobaculia bacterium]